MSRKDVRTRGFIWTIVTLALVAGWGFGLHGVKGVEFEVTDRVFVTWICFSFCSLSSMNALLCFVQLSLNYSCVKSIEGDRFVSALYGGSAELIAWSVFYGQSIDPLISVIAAYSIGVGVAVWVISVAFGLENG